MTLNDKIETRFENAGKSKTFRNIAGEFHLGSRKVLDVGCSYGEFLAHFGKESVGVTIVKEEAEYGKTKGLRIVEGNIESDVLNIATEEKFDVIFANNIFEHLLSPHLFLQKIRRHIKEDGILILGVPCVPFFSFLMKMRKFRGALAGSHINFFTKKTLALTVMRGGWRIKEERSFHFKNVFFDTLLGPIVPHFYVIAVPDKNFHYNEKHLRDLSGYSKNFSPAGQLDGISAINAKT
jgi:SAM-dependent methyltransferase